MEDIGLGRLVESNDAKRDAVHVACVPVVASQKLEPGDHVGILPNGQASLDDPIVGVVDPFLKEYVKKGQRFWLCLFPGTIKSIRHDWTHPSFPSEGEAAAVLDGMYHMDARYRESEDWLKDYAHEVDMTLGELIEVTKTYLASGEGYTLGYNTPSIVYQEREDFWRHFKTVCRDAEVEDGKDDTFFRCAC